MSRPARGGFEESAMEEVTLARATAAIQASLAHARQKSLGPLTVVVLDAGGHVRASAREDGAGFSGIDIASAKARGALSFSMSSRRVAEIFGGDAALCATLAATMNGQMLPIPGAVLINDPAGRVIGAIAAAGDAPDNDEAAAMAGLSSL
jgi:uncharacterized protein GlcG (DUF336 family)